MVGKALSPGSPATQCVEHGSRVRMLAPITRPNEGPVHNMRVHQFRPKRCVLGLFPFPHGLRAILAGRSRVWGGDANVERSALVHRKCRCKDISRAGARGTSDEAKDLWLGCSISQPRVIKEHVTHLVVAPGAGPTGTAHWDTIKHGHKTGRERTHPHDRLPSGGGPQ